MHNTAVVSLRLVSMEVHYLDEMLTVSRGTYSLEV